MEKANNLESNVFLVSWLYNVPIYYPRAYYKYNVDIKFVYFVSQIGRRLGSKLRSKEDMVECSIKDQVY